MRNAMIHCILFVFGNLAGCSGSNASSGDIGGADVAGGSTSNGGVSSSATGGSSIMIQQTGGALSATTGGVPSSGGAGAQTGGAKPSGGSNSAPSVATGGIQATGGKSPTGGAVATGGLQPTGGKLTGGASTGGASPTGGIKATGGASNTSSGSATGGRNTGGNTSTGGTSNAGSSGFSPCPASGTACKILPLGDSITYGLTSSDGGGYREPLFKLAVSANQKITFTGSQMNGPTSVTVNGTTMTFPRNNEGHSGWTIDQIAGLVPSPAMSTIPNIVLLMAGTNDVYASSGQSTMNTRLGSLIDKIVTAAPNALVVVATLTPLSNASWNSTANTYDGQIPAVVQARASQGKHVITVDMSKMPVSELSDGIHPNDAGYAYMAGIWYAAIKNLLPT